MRCPITYEHLNDPSSHYSPEGIHLLSPRLRQLQDFPYSQQEQLEQARQMSGKLSIQGVQPKLSVTLDVKQQGFSLTTRGGTHIIKMQSSWPTLPENEDVTMRLAQSVGLNVPRHGLIYCKDGTLSYWIQRFDRQKKITPEGDHKIDVEDFAQLSQETRYTKYDSSMEKVIAIVEKYTTFPMIEKEKLFILTLFNFLVGNEDMHLKNFSLIRQNKQVLLSPVYDLLNTTLALGDAAHEESALPLNGKKNKWKREDIIDYLALTRLQIPKARVDNTLNTFIKMLPHWKNTIDICFLPQEAKERYWTLVMERAGRVLI